MKLIWTDPSIEDLRALRDYFASTSAKPLSIAPSAISTSPLEMLRWGITCQRP